MAVFSETAKTKIAGKPIFQDFLAISIFRALEDSNPRPFGP